jgi:hypothetical protein
MQRIADVWSKSSSIATKNTETTLMNEFWDERNDALIFFPFHNKP